MSDAKPIVDLESKDESVLPESDETNDQRSRTTAYERNNQLLAYDWRALTPGDIARITAIFSDTLKTTPEPLIALEATFALAACLFTGRKLDELYALQIAQLEFWPIDGSEVKPGLVKCASSWGWWLPAGIPAEQKHRNEQSAAQAIQRSIHLWLPAAPPVAETVLRVLTRRGHRNMSEPVPMFETPLVELATAMKALLTGDKAVRRAGTTIEAVERWLTGAVCLTPGGDAAIATIMTARPGLLARTTSYYSSIGQTLIERAWNAAVQPVMAIEPRQAPSNKLRAQFYGGRYCPQDSEVVRLQQRLHHDVREAATGLEYHRALTLYTAVLLSLAVAHCPVRIR